VQKFKVDALKSKNYIVYHQNYRFKEDWLLQAYLLKCKKAIDFIQFLDQKYGEKVRIIRETYTCSQRKVFTDPAGFKLEFLDKKLAEEYCEMLNGLV